MCCLVSIGAAHGVLQACEGCTKFCVRDCLDYGDEAVNRVWANLVLCNDSLLGLGNGRIEQVALVEEAKYIALAVVIGIIRRIGVLSQKNSVQGILTRGRLVISCSVCRSQIDWLRLPPA